MLTYAAVSSRKWLAEGQGKSLCSSVHFNISRPVSTESQRNSWTLKWLIFIFCVWISTLPCQLFASEVKIRTQGPSKKPLIGKTYINDRDRNAIEDQLEQRLENRKSDLVRAFSAKGRSEAHKQLDEFVEVELIFKSQIKQNHLDSFEQMGGKVDYVYKAISYGWNGKVPLRELRAISSMMGSELVLIHESKPIHAHLDVATSNGRVRPVWAPGFAGSTSGFKGTDSITIAIVDSGVDLNHLDMQGRCVYWQDYSYDNSPTPIDKYHHGSHVAGIATGTGLSRGSEPGTLYYTDRSAPFLTFSDNGYFQPNLIGLPDTQVVFNSTAHWFGEAPTSLYLLSKPKGINTPSYVSNDEWIAISDPTTGYTPLTENNMFTASSDMLYTTALPANTIDYSHVVGRFVITNAVENFSGTDDGFNQLSGVAPGCNWAASKVFTKDGLGKTLWVEMALDDLVANRIEKKIKVINLSLGMTGSPGLSPSLRQKINTAVSNGVVVVVSAGNDGRGSTEDERVIDDPGRAAYAITVAAANDENQLTDYSSQGFIDPNNSTGQEEDYKPDITAPGGSIYHSFILSVDSGSGDGGSFLDQQSDDYTQFRGTSMASPYIAGCAALVIDALEQKGVVWDFNSVDDPFFVKMVLSATASETNAPRENGILNPSLERASEGLYGSPSGKDINEGYGLVNADAAVEAVSQEYVLDTTATEILGDGLHDKRVWARSVYIPAGVSFEPYLLVPHGADYDLYLYSSQPGLYGRPTILASSTNAGTGVNESLSYLSQADFTGFVVVKRVSGAGEFRLTTLTLSHQITASSEPNGMINPNGLIAKEYGSDQLFTAIPDPGYQVDSWSVDGVEMQTGGETFLLSDITADHTVTVNFKRIIPTYTITASAGAKGAIDPNGELTRQYDSHQLFTAIPDLGYKVDTWWVDEVASQFGRTNFILSNIHDDHTVNVTFTLLTYTVNASAGTNGSIEPSGLITKEFGSDQQFVATPNPGYEVDTWVVDGAEVKPSEMTYTLSDITASHTVAVNFKQRATCTLVASAGANGSIDPSGLLTTQYGSDQEFTATPDSGYKVDTWWVDDVESQFGRTSFILSNIQDNHTVNVTFTLLTYMVYASAGTNGSIDPSGLITKEFGSDQQFVAIPNTGYEVDTWMIDGVEVESNETTYTLFDITASHTVAVNFKQRTTCTLVASAGTNGSIDPNGVLTTQFGSDQEFTATPNPGYQVDSWSLDGSVVQADGDTYRLNNIVADHTVEVSFSKIQCVISGYIFEPDGSTPVEGVVVDANNGAGSDTTDTSGYYELTVDFGWTGVVDPNKTGYTFDPNSRIYENVAADQNYDNYMAILDTFIVSGYIIDSNTLAPLVEVLVTPDNNGGPFTGKYYNGGSCLTDINGYYTVLVDYQWSGNTIPWKYAYVFEPNSISYTNVPEDIIEEQDYVGNLLTYTITGYIKNDCETPIEGVVVSANNGGGSDSTDPNGFYEIWIDYNWSGKIAPEKVNYTFDPNSNEYTNVLNNITDQNYAATNIYDLNCDGLIDLGDLGILSEDWLYAPELTPDFYQDEVNIINLLDFADFARAWRASHAESKNN